MPGITIAPSIQFLNTKDASQLAFRNTIIKQLQQVKGKFLKEPLSLAGKQTTTLFIQDAQVLGEEQIQRIRQQFFVRENKNLVSLYERIEYPVKNQAPIVTWLSYGQMKYSGI